MRHLVVPILCATVLIGAAFAAGCAEPLPPQPPPLPPPPLPIVTQAPPPELPPPPPPTRRQRTRVTEFTVDATTGIKLPGPVVFEPLSDKLSAVSDSVLEVVHDYLDANPDVNLLRIEGHTDNDGTPDANQILSEKRAMNVARWLVAVGVKCNRLIPVGFGQTKELVPNTTPENKAQNRRIAFHPAAIKGRPVGGLLVDGGGKPAGDPCR